MATHRRTRKASELKALNINLNKFIDAERMQRLTSIAILRRYWHDIVGTMMAERTEPVAIEPQHDGSLGLLIEVDHPVIADIIRRDLYNDIRLACFKRCKLHGLTKVWTKIQDGAGIREEKIVKHQRDVSYPELRLLAESLQDVEDKALRRQMFRAATAQLRNAQLKN